MAGLPAILLLSACTGLTIDLPSAPQPEPQTVVITPITANLIAVQAEALQRQQKSSAAEAAPLSAVTEPYLYRLGVGDLLEIAVPTIAAFGALAPQQQPGSRAAGDTFSIAADGTIIVPYVDHPVAAAGKTVRELQIDLIRELTRFLRVPQVNISVVQFRSQKILISGQVPKPGYEPVTDVPLTIIGALQMAGAELPGNFHNVPRTRGVLGLAGEQNTDLSQVALIRDHQRRVFDVESMLKHGNVSDDWVLKDGDAIYVPPAQNSYIFLLGEVKEQGLVQISDGRSTLAEVITLVGGLNQPTANGERVYVIRGDMNQPQIFQLNANTANALLLADAFKLMPRDVVYVSEAGISRWNRFFEDLVPLLSELLTTGLIVNQVGR